MKILVLVFAKPLLAAVGLVGFTFGYRSIDFADPGVEAPAPVPFVEEDAAPEREPAEDADPQPENE